MFSLFRVLPFKMLGEFIGFLLEIDFFRFLGRLLGLSLLPRRLKRGFYFFAFFCLDSFCSKRFPIFSAMGLSLSFQPVARLHCSVVDGISHFRHLVDGHFQSHQHPSIQILIHTCP